MAGNDYPRGTQQFRLLARYVIKTWRDTDRSLRTAAEVMWVIAGLLTLVGSYLDF